VQRQGPKEQHMKVFISWSGEKSRLVALALRSFLQDVNQRIIAWFSDSDIQAGDRWGSELAGRLESSNYGIICVTQESLESSWVLFEAGALGKAVSGGKVCPYLIDLTRRQLTGPLNQFQSKEATKEQTWEMLLSINYAMDDSTLTEDRLKKYFDRFWPELEQVVIQVNRQYQPLPKELRKDLLDTLPPAFYQTREIEMHAQFAGLPVWMINWNQAAFFIWSELIQVATDERKLGEFMTVLASKYEHNPTIQALKSKVDAWEASIKQDT
jgi:hypothetical protein